MRSRVAPSARRRARHDRSTKPEIKAWFDQLLRKCGHRICAGCKIALRDHKGADHNFFERWGEQDETWSG